LALWASTFGFGYVVVSIVYVSRDLARANIGVSAFLLLGLDVYNQYIEVMLNVFMSVVCVPIVCFFVWTWFFWLAISRFLERRHLARS